MHQRMRSCYRLHTIPSHAYSMAETYPTALAGASMGRYLKQGVPTSYAVRLAPLLTTSTFDLHGQSSRLLWAEISFAPHWLSRRRKRSCGTSRGCKHVWMMVGVDTDPELTSSCICDDEFKEHHVDPVACSASIWLPTR
jgi:hypothetical protein